LQLASASCLARSASFCSSFSSRLRRFPDIVSVPVEQPAGAAPENHRRLWREDCDVTSRDLKCRRRSMQLRGKLN
jgi:hypothetical protein